MDRCADREGTAPAPSGDAADGGSPVVLFCGADFLMPEASEQADPSLPAFHPAFAPAFEIHSSFTFGGRTFAAAELRDSEIEEAGLGRARRVALRSFIGLGNESAASFALKARAHAHWASVSRFCASCGSPLVQGRGPENEGGRTCSNCGRTFFPRISPAVIVLVSKGDEILLAHNARFPAGRHGLIAGFVELGETLEETLRREVMEEAGIEVEDLNYVKSQPWPFPDSLMLGFEARWLSGEARPDGLEIDHLGWFSRGRLPDIPPPGSVARFLIDRFLSKAR
jgi:NAD+ diphosphatase